MSPQQATFAAAGMGLVYASFWPLFPEHAYSRVACAGVPLLSTLAVAAVGVGLIHDKALVAAAAVRVVQFMSLVLWRSKVA